MKKSEPEMRRNVEHGVERRRVGRMKREGERNLQISVKDTSFPGTLVWHLVLSEQKSITETKCQNSKRG